MRAPIQAGMRRSGHAAGGRRACRLRPQGCRAGRATRPRAPVTADEEKVLNVYNWSDYIDPDRDRGFREGNRHQGQLRRLRLQRGARDQAARRQLRLRRRRAVRLFPRAPDQGRRLPEARQVAAAEPQEPRSGAAAARRGARPGQRARRDLHVGHVRHRLQRRQDQGDHARRADRQLGDSCSIRRWCRSSRTAACRCSTPRPTSSAPCCIYLGKDPEQRESGRPQGRRGGAAQGPALRPHHQHLAVHRGPRQRRDLPGAGLVSGDVLQARDRAEEAGKGIDISTSSRRKARSCGSTCSPSRPTPRTPKNAHLFIDYLLRPDVAAKNSNFVSYANSNAASLAAGRPRTAERPGHLSRRRKCRPKLRARTSPKSAEFTRLLTRAWTRFMTGR